MTTRTLPALLMFAAFMALPDTGFAQTPPPPPPGWAGSASAGLAMTQGNSDTSTLNAAYELKHDSGGSIVIKSSGLVVWSKAEETVTSDRLSFDDRIERKLSTRTSLFAQSQYLRDKFKSIDHLFAPTVGISRLLVKDALTELGVTSRSARSRRNQRRSAVRAQADVDDRAQGKDRGALEDG